MYNFTKLNSFSLNCLRKGHTVANYNRSFCRKCIPHHRLLHKQHSQPINTFVGCPSATKNTMLNTSSMNTRSNNKMVLLTTGVVQIRNNYGNLQHASAILDFGSQISIITEEFANRLAIKGSQSDVHINDVGEMSDNINQFIIYLIYL